MAALPVGEAVSRSSSTIVIHKYGTVTYWSATRRAMTTALPENIDHLDLVKMSARDQQRLVNRFGRRKAGSGWCLMSAAELLESRCPRPPLAE